MQIIKKFRISPLLNNCYLINNEGTLVLIDAPGEIYKVIDFLKVNNVELEEVWLTHIHYDHIVGLPELKEHYPKLKVYCSDEEGVLINDGKSNLVGEFGTGKFEYEGEILDNSQLETSNIKVKYISGHSKKSSVYIFVKDKEMFSGDVLFNGSVGRSDLIYGDNEKLINGIKENLLSFEDFKVYPGHGFATTIKDEIKRNKFLNE